MADILIRKRAFVHLDEYLTRHPDFANAVRDRPCKCFSLARFSHLRAVVRHICDPTDTARNAKLTTKTAYTPAHSPSPISPSQHLPPPPRLRPGGERVPVRATIARSSSPAGSAMTSDPIGSKRSKRQNLAARRGKRRRGGARRLLLRDVSAFRWGTGTVVG